MSTLSSYNEGCYRLLAFCASIRALDTVKRSSPLGVPSRPRSCCARHSRPRVERTRLTIAPWRRRRAVSVPLSCSWVGLTTRRHFCSTQSGCSPKSEAATRRPPGALALGYRASTRREGLPGATVATSRGCHGANHVRRDDAHPRWRGQPEAVL